MPPLTPLDIQHKEFTKAMRGYAMHEVDTFLDQVTEEFTRLQDESERLRQQQAAGPQAAQVTAKSMVGEAEARAKNMTEQSQMRAREVTEAAQMRARELTEAAQMRAREVTEAAQARARELTEGLETRYKERIQSAEARARVAEEQSRMQIAQAT